MIVKIKMMKPQNVTKCAAPGTVHFSSFRWPNTSSAWTSTSRPTCERTASTRSGAGCPARPSRPSHHRRRPAIAAAATVISRPRTILRATGTSSCSVGCQRTPPASACSGPPHRVPPGRPGIYRRASYRPVTLRTSAGCPQPALPGRLTPLYIPNLYAKRGLVQVPPVCRARPAAGSIYRHTAGQSLTRVRPEAGRDRPGGSIDTPNEGRRGFSRAQGKACRRLHLDAERAWSRVSPALAAHQAGCAAGGTAL